MIFFHFFHRIMDHNFKSKILILRYFIFNIIKRKNFLIYNSSHLIEEYLQQTYYIEPSDIYRIYYRYEGTIENLQFNKIRLVVENNNHQIIFNDPFIGRDGSKIIPETNSKSIFHIGY